MAVVALVPPEAAGERLDRYLAGLDAVGSRTEAERLLATGHVLVDGVTRAKSYRLAGGERVELTVPELREPRSLEPEEVAGIGVPYEDEHLLVVDKPAGIAVHPGAGTSTGTLVHGLLTSGIGGGE